MASSSSWELIFKRYCGSHDFDKSPCFISAPMIKDVVSRRKTSTAGKEVRILAKQDTRESRPKIFEDRGLFLLPIKNGEYVIVKGEGYVDIPEIESKAIEYDPKLEFDLDTAHIGDSEMQHVDYAYAISIIRSFMRDPSLVLTIRGRKYTPPFSFNVGSFRIDTKSVQTEVDAGYEGKEQVVLIEAKPSKMSNTIIRQLYYPFRQWQDHTKKPVKTLFFGKSKGEYMIWEFQFVDKNDYNSIRLIRSERFKIV